MEIKTTYDRLLELIIREKEENNLTLNYLSELVYYSSDTLSKYIYGKKCMPSDVLFALLQALGYRFEVFKPNYSFKQKEGN